MLSREIQDAISKIKGRTHQGSSVQNNTLYHNLPFPELDKIPSHRKNTLLRWNHIKNKSGINFSNKTVIDIGCSAGGLSMLAAKERAKTVIGFDYDVETINLAKLIIKELKLGNIDFVCTNIDLDWIKSLRYFDIVLWFSQWMWMVKQYGLEIAKDMLFEISKKTKTLIFESAADDAMAAIKGATQDDIRDWLWECTMYSQIKDIGYVEGWNRRHNFYMYLSYCFLERLYIYYNAYIEKNNAKEI